MKVVDLPGCDAKVFISKNFTNRFAPVFYIHVLHRVGENKGGNSEQTGFYTVPFKMQLLTLLRGRHWKKI